MNKKIYADHAATTPVDASVLEAMLPFLGGCFHNPSALYGEAREVRVMIDDARSVLLDFIGGDSEGRIIFTGSGTESANLALYSALHSALHLPTRPSDSSGQQRPGSLLDSAAEHHAVLNYAHSLNSSGIVTEELPVDRYGAVAPDTLRKHIKGDVMLVSVMTVNNETGAINDTGALCKIAHDAGALFHTDAVQALGIMPINAQKNGADYISFSAHKIYGPKGIGALYVSPAAALSPLVLGGKQEGGARAGTENTAGIAGFGRAVTLLRGRLEKDATHLAALKSLFLKEIAAIPGIIINSAPGGAPNIINISAAGVEAEPCLLHLSMAGILASMGAACNASSVEPSHVVKAIGVPQEYQRGTLRFSFGRDNTEEDVKRCAQELAAVLGKMR